MPNRKRYLADTYGTEAEFWEMIWKRSDLRAALRFCEVDPLRKVFERFFPHPPERILEGGSGLGQYVVYYRRKGYLIEGIDYAKDTVARIAASEPAAVVREGDIRKLPFADNEFGAYYSGGVFEHFEQGAAAALREAHRVLKDRGILIVTVPYLNGIRRLQDFWRWNVLRKRSVKCCIDGNGFLSAYVRTNGYGSDAAGVPGYHFHEYVYSKAEFSGELVEAGFEIIHSQGVYVLWGMADIALFRKALKTDALLRNPQEKTVPSGTSGVSGQQGQQKHFLKRLLVQEQGAGFLRYLFAHMYVFVCRANKADK